MHSKIYISIVQSDDGLFASILSYSLHKKLSDDAMCKPEYESNNSAINVVT